jgi:hypothetical protein
MKNVSVGELILEVRVRLGGSEGTGAGCDDINNKIILTSKSSHFLFLFKVQVCI